MKKILLESISKQVNDKKLTGDSQHDFIKWKICLTNLVNFYNAVTSLVDDIFYFYFRKAFDSDSPKTQTKYSFDT